MDRTTTSEADPRGRYCAVDTASGDVVIFDRDDADAWFQSDFAVALGR